jgi:hypothetical protein
MEGHQLADKSITSNLVCLYSNTPQSLCGAYIVYKELVKTRTAEQRCECKTKQFIPVPPRMLPSIDDIVAQHVIVIGVEFTPTDVICLLRYVKSLTVISNTADDVARRISATRPMMGLLKYPPVEVINRLHVDLSRAVWDWIHPAAPYPPLVEIVSCPACPVFTYMQQMDNLATFALAVRDLELDG